MNNLQMYEEWQLPWNKNKYNNQIDSHEFMTEEAFERFNYQLKEYDMEISPPVYYKDGEYFVWIVGNKRRWVTHYNIYTFLDDNFVILENMNGGKKIKMPNIITAIQRIIEIENGNRISYNQKMRQIARTYAQEYPPKSVQPDDDTLGDPDGAVSRGLPKLESVKTFEEFGSGDVPAGCGTCGKKKKKKEKKLKKMKWSSDIMAG